MRFLLLCVGFAPLLSAQLHNIASYPVRLVGAEATAGRVEIRVNGSWGTVCDSNWDTHDAAVVCHQLGIITSQSVQPVGGAFFGQGFGPILMNNLKCSGYELELADCPFDGFYSHSGCSHTNDASVLCQPESIPVRLVGSAEGQGLVEIQINGDWGSICDSGWGSSDARVVCRQLGFNDTHAQAVGGSFFGQSHGPIYWQNMKCSGFESYISSCGNDGYGRHSCSHSNDAGVICHPYDIPVRLMGAEAGMGRVEIEINGLWGSVCDSYWDYIDAQVVCRQLGFEDPHAYAVGESFFGSSNGPIYWSNVNCNGNEPHLSACGNQGYGRHSCSRNQDAGVICHPMQIPIRLVGAEEGEGRVEIKINGLWGTICDERWNYKNAEVVCRQLGFNHSYAMAVSQSLFGGGSGPIYFTNVECTGSEPHITMCVSNVLGHHGCDHRMDAGVICNPFEVRLVGGQRASEGRVEVKLNGQWGTVCENYFDDRDAQVICRQLGYNNSNARAWGRAHFGQGSGLIYLSNVDCVGSEPFLAACHSYWFRITDCSHSQDAGVSCH